jgi:subfamily B ATP-binding cassette protein MsbA
MPQDHNNFVSPEISKISEISEGQSSEQSKTTGALLKRLLKTYLLPHWKMLLVSLLFMVVAAGMTAAIAQLMQPVLDDVMVDQDAARIIPVALAVFCAFFLRGLTTYIHTIMTVRIGQAIVGDIQRDLFNKFMTLDLAFFHANPSGQLLSRVVNDVNVMRIAVADSVTGFGKNVLTLLFLVAVMVYQDWKLTMIAFVIMPFATGFVIYLGRRLRKVSGRTQDEMARLSDMLSQIFQGIRQVKAYGMEEHEKTRAGAAILKVRSLNVKASALSNLSTPVNEILVGLVLMGVIIYGGYQTAQGAMTAGQLAAFLAAFIMAYEPMKKLARLNNAIQMGLGAAERVFGLMDTPSNIRDKPQAQSLDSNAPEIVFDHVEFQYEETGFKALNSINFTAQAGKVLALVGPSGGGKSTIINLIPRFYDVHGGAIRVNGVDVRDYTAQSLRAHIALVSQDITIFDDTILNNIRYGRFDARDEEVFAAAQSAHAHDFITQMAEGYQTVLGEDGVRLSGGQRQRIAIARAILRNAPILLLDEATSALDNESEQAVQKALEKLEKGRTTIVIAHRLSTVQKADMILVLDKGRIVEQGTHNALIAQNGLYTKMYHAGL